MRNLRGRSPIWLTVLPEESRSFFGGMYERRMQRW